MTARPDTATVQLDGDEDFVVVACDGLWDFVSEDDVALSVYRQLAADPGKWCLFSLLYDEVVVTGRLWDYVAQVTIMLLWRPTWVSKVLNSS